MGIVLSLEEKCTVISVTCGLTLLVSGGVFYLISAGRPDPVWLVLGALGVSLGLLLLLASTLLWLCAVRWFSTPSTDSKYTETETINTSDV